MWLLVRKQHNHRWQNATERERELLWQRGDIIQIFDRESEVGRLDRIVFLLIEVPGELKVNHMELIGKSVTDRVGTRRQFQIDMVTLRASMTLSERGGFDTGRVQLSRSDGMSKINNARRSRPKAA